MIIDTERYSHRSNIFLSDDSLKDNNVTTFWYWLSNTTTSERDVQRISSSDRDVYVKVAPAIHMYFRVVLTIGPRTSTVKVLDLD